MLLGWLPARIQLLSPVRVFSKYDEGTSFVRLWQKIEDLEPTIIVIQTTAAEVGTYNNAKTVMGPAGHPDGYNHQVFKLAHLWSRNSGYLDLAGTTGMQS